MLLKSWFCASLLAMVLTLGGCYPPSNARDEETNPYFQAGKERVAARDYQGAVEAFEKALEHNPKSALAHFELGVLYEQRMNDYPAAIYHYNKVIQLRPNRSYPAENAEQRIPGCKLEMIKNDTLATMNPVAMNEIQRLRQENQQLRQYLEGWTAWWKRNSVRLQQAYVPNQSAQSVKDDAYPEVGYSGNSFSRGTALEDTRHQTQTSTRSHPPRKQHTVKKNDTPFAIAKQYDVSLPAFMSANPGLNPTRLKVGQKVNIP